ncbi:chorismate-binding protein [Rubrivirga sp. S365]|uniref:chorismate-binding protein n=1 Tax=Rubrivirga sp. S365 TaxID=3076080 RepID=UPI0028C7EA15|nr:chorismate-binding protein [Rubrivirga sp. S365]MDT7857720.1 chorismate-binding protein [Rubrivirga sp. S365]
MLADALRQPGAVLLDAPRPDADTGRRGALLFSAPRRTLVAWAPEEVGPLLDALDRALADGHHVAGTLAYEAGYALHPSVGAAPHGGEPATPLGWFGVYDAPEAVSGPALDAALPAGGAAVRDLAFAWSPAAYAERLAAVREHIRRGDVYQANLTAPFRFRLDGDAGGDALGLFAALRARQPVSYGAFLRLPAPPGSAAAGGPQTGGPQTGGAAVASVSPELFFRVDPPRPQTSGGAGRTITARPMKGTAPRAASAAEDRALAEALRASPKDRAENLMIVDLLRNDLARVSELGSVRVPALFEPERYETVTQLTSTVRAALRPDAGLADVLRALFPCGSITGAPKLRAMQLLRDLEDGPRGVYCGAIGYAAPAAGGGLGRAAFSVPIRTAVVGAAGAGRYDVGSGVVWDSRADAEYAECLLKARVLTDL